MQKFGFLRYMGLVIFLFVGLLSTACDAVADIEDPLVIPTEPSQSSQENPEFVVETIVVPFGSDVDFGYSEINDLEGYEVTNEAALHVFIVANEEVGDRVCVIDEIFTYQYISSLKEYFGGRNPTIDPLEYRYQLVWIDPNHDYKELDIVWRGDTITPYNLNILQDDRGEYAQVLLNYLLFDGYLHDDSQATPSMRCSAYDRLVREILARVVGRLYGQENIDATPLVADIAIDGQTVYSLDEYVELQQVRGIKPAVTTQIEN